MSKTKRRSPASPPAAPPAPAWLPIAGLALLTLAMFGDVLFAGGTRVVGMEGTDLYSQFVPWRDFGFRQLREGNLALWNPHIYCGAPYFGGMQAALLYPPNWIFLILSLATAINWSIALHVFLLGALMFAWLRVRGLNATCAFFGGALMMFCGAHFLHVYAGHLPNLCAMVWAPLIFCAIDGFLEKRKAGWCLLGMFAVAMQIFAGHPQYVFYTAIIAGIYSALKLVVAWNWRTAAGLLSIYFGGAALAAVQLLTGAQATNETIRNMPVPFEFAAMFAFPPENFLTLIAPNFFGEMSNYWGRCYLWEMSLFIGVTGFLLAVHAAVFCERKTKWIPLTMLGVALLLALGVHTPLFALLYSFAPGFNKFRGISKFIFPASLFLVLLAAMGLQQLFDKKKTGRNFIIAVFGLAGLLFVFALWTMSTGSWHALLNAVKSTKESYLPPQAFTSGAFAAQTQNIAGRSLFFAAITSALFGGLLLFLQSDRRVLYAIAGLGILEVFVFALNTRPTFDSANVVPADEKRFLAEHPGDYRILNPLNPNSAMLVGTGDIWGGDPGVVRRYAEFVAWTQGIDPDKATQYVNSAKFDPLYALMRLRCAFIPTQNGVQIAETPTPPMPHVQLISKYRVVQNRNAIFSTLRAESFDPQHEIVLENEPQPKPAQSDNAGTATLISQTTDALTIEADAPQPALLLITDVWTPAWRAVALSGSAQSHYDVLPADYFLRAIPLSAGHHKLRVEYAPRAFFVGKWISIFASVAFLAAAAFCARSRFYKSAA